MSDTNQIVKLRAIAGLAKNESIEPWKQLFGHFAAETPIVQRAILDGSFASVARSKLLLDEITAGRVKAAVIDLVHAELLLKNKDQAIRRQAKKVLASSVPADRATVLADYEPVLKM